MTKPIYPSDLSSLDAYANTRKPYVDDMIQKKKKRRVQRHPNISVLFENRDTVLYQIRELIFSEDLEDEDEIREYIDVYSPMLPLAGELSATLFIELDNQVQLEEMLRRLKGIEHHLRLEVEHVHVLAVFEEEHDDRDSFRARVDPRFARAGLSELTLSPTNPEQLRTPRQVPFPHASSVQLT